MSWKSKTAPTEPVGAAPDELMIVVMDKKAPASEGGRYNGGYEHED
jgi:hypothetical protein